MRFVTTMMSVMISGATACSAGGTAAPASPPPADVVPPNRPGTDSGASVDSGLLNGCAQADFDTNNRATPDGDAGASARTITFPRGAPAQYTPACMTIKASQSVTWTGSFAVHPMEAFPGDPDAGTRNPIKVVDVGDTAVFTFPEAGTFGFHCQDHPSIMYGAILVVP